MEKELSSYSLARFGHSATKFGHWLFVFGGCGGESYVNEVNLLNLGKFILLFILSLSLSLSLC